MAGIWFRGGLGNEGRNELCSKMVGVRPDVVQQVVPHVARSGYCDLKCFESVEVIQLNLHRKAGVCFCQALQEYANPGRCFGKDLPERCHLLLQSGEINNHQES